MQDARFCYDKYQPRLVGGDLVQGGEDRILGEYDELSEVSLDLQRMPLYLHAFCPADTVMDIKAGRFGWPLGPAGASAGWSSARLAACV